MLYESLRFWGVGGAYVLVATFFFSIYISALGWLESFDIIGFLKKVTTLT
jgi:hypothetical protein